ncbi:MAG TPA: phosphopantetheine-binding protein [Kiloniellaceae bacterium]|nr:phosphopantetheine-binding protein [Kiloniellaceae bacterium]
MAAPEVNVSGLTPLQLEVAALLVETLNLEVSPEDIEVDAPLFYEGLGLDSIDALELALEITRRYGFELRAEDEANQQIFGSLAALSLHIEKNRKT